MTDPKRPGRPKIIMFQGKNLDFQVKNVHFLLDNLHLYNEITDPEEAGHTIGEKGVLAVGVVACLPLQA